MSTVHTLHFTINCYKILILFFYLLDILLVDFSILIFKLETEKYLWHVIIFICNKNEQ